MRQAKRRGVKNFVKRETPNVLTRRKDQSVFRGSVCKFMADASFDVRGIIVAGLLLWG